MSQEEDYRKELEDKMYELGEKLREVGELWHEIDGLVDKVETDPARREALRQQVASILSPGISPLHALIGLHYGGLGPGGFGIG